MPMNKEKVKLIVKNMELLIQSLNLELEDPELEKENIVSLEDLLHNQLNTHSTNLYEPDYYEEE
jgi:hypothetical protein